MSLQQFPETVEVKKFFSRQGQLTTSLPLQKFTRLEQYLANVEADDSSEIEVDLDFIQDDEGRFILKGSMKGALLLSCQRCLQGVEYSLSSDFRVQIIDELKVGGDTELAKDELEVVLSTEGKLNLFELVEDEVILSLPLVVYHDEPDCNQVLVDLNRSAEQNIESKPFAELEVLKKQLSSEKSKTK
ncbi:MAG: DUF177 domain-containing protein [Gammaproteobacteria bacterium]|jgi:uncharacterized protein|nr:DUF177 domain-containing protein [Gammaproteobacteria bacterium]